MITLEEMENISFRKSGFSGYRSDDVDDFTEKVIQKVKSLERANKELEARVEQLNAEISKHKEKEESVQSALITAEMTAKQIVMEATRKSDELLSESNEKAEAVVRQAQERADQIDQEANAKIEELINKTLRESSAQIEENNLIIEAQKENLIRLMSEANKFRNYLIQSYKDHLKNINEMTKPEDIQRKKTELDVSYPVMHGNQPIPVEQPAYQEPAPAAADQQPAAEEFTYVGDPAEETAAAQPSEPAEQAAPAIEEKKEIPAESSSTDVVLTGSPVSLRTPPIGGDDRRRQGKHKKRR